MWKTLDRIWMIVFMLLAPLLNFGCGPVESESPSPEKKDGGPDAGCAPGEFSADGGACQPAGLPPDMPCQPGETSAEGACLPAGIPANACAPGFLAKGGGCEPVLPETICPKGQMAVPGDKACREVATCGADLYGKAPMGAGTIYVNAAYPGADSNGTMGKPWKTIQQAVDSASSGAVIAIAKGVYAESVFIKKNKHVSLWGACPVMVEIKGMSANSAAVEIHAEKTEVHDLAVTGAGFGVSIFDVANVVLQEVWVHDTPLPGVQALGAPQTSVTVEGSLIEAVGAVGADAEGTSITLERSVVRKTKIYNGDLGFGASATDYDGQRAHLSIHGSVLEQSGGAGIYDINSDVEVDASVVRETAADSVGSGLGRGAWAASTTKKGAPATLAVSRCVFEKNYTSGVTAIAASLTMDATVIRKTRALSAADFAAAVFVSDWPATKRGAEAAISRCSIEGNEGTGVSVTSSTATISATRIHDVKAGGAAYGWGVELAGDDGRATVEMDGSVVEAATDIGVLVGGSDATITATSIRGTRSSATESTEGGVVVFYQPDSMARSKLELRGCEVAENPHIGVIVVGSDALIESTYVHDTTDAGDADYGGRGIGLYQNDTNKQGSTATIRSSLVERNKSAGIFTFNSKTTVEGTKVSATKAGDGGFGVVAIAGAAGTASLSIVGSLLDSNDFVGLGAFNIDLSVDSTSIINTKPVSGVGGYGALIAEGKASIKSSEVRSSSNAGIAIYSSDATIVDTRVSDTKAQPINKAFGDGIVVFSQSSPATAKLDHVDVSTNARAGLSVFGATVTLDSCTFRCNKIDIDLEDTAMSMASIGTPVDTRCGCPEATGECRVVSSDLEAPTALPEPPAQKPPVP